MIAYIDSSVLLRIVLRQPSPLDDWPNLTIGVASHLIAAECYRAIDQLWHRGDLTQEEVTEKRAIIGTFVKRLDLRDIDAAVLDLTSQPLPTPLATLDSIHLSTAMLAPWNRRAPESHPSFTPATNTAPPRSPTSSASPRPDFSTLFRKSAIKRAKLAGMQRNVEALTAGEDRGILGS